MDEALKQLDYLEGGARVSEEDLQTALRQFQNNVDTTNKLALQLQVIQDASGMERFAQTMIPFVEQG